MCACLKADLRICLCAFICVCLGCVSQCCCVSLSLLCFMFLSVPSLCVHLLCDSVLNCLTLLSLYAYLSLLKGFTLFLLTSPESIVWIKEWEMLTEIFNRVYKALCHRLQLVTTGTYNKCYLSTNIQVQNIYDRF